MDSPFISGDDLISKLLSSTNPLLLTQDLFHQGIKTLNDYHQRTLLHFAAKTGNHACCKWLTDQGMDVNTCDNLGMTPLHLAITSGNVTVVKLLIAKGAKLSTDNNGDTQAHFLARHPDRKIAMNICMAFRGHEQKINKDGHTPFSQLLEEEALNIVLADIFLTTGLAMPSITDVTNVNEWNNFFQKFYKKPAHQASVFYAACSLGLISVAENLLEFFENKTITTEAFLYTACNGQITFAKWLLEKNPNLIQNKNNNCDNAFLYAALHGQIEFAEWLLTKDPNFIQSKNDNDENAFLYAAYRGQIEFAEWLLKKIRVLLKV